MKILWITNVLFPDVCVELGIAESVSGGWVYSSALSLCVHPTMELAVATLYNGKVFKKIVLGNMTYYLLPFSGDKKKYCTKFEDFSREINHSFQPDVVHIHGTEYAFGLAYIKACGNKNVVVSIQGLVSVYERYYYAGIQTKEMLKTITFRDIVRTDTIFQQRKKMFLRGVIEKDYIQSVKHIIGRTSWDMTHAWAINPSAEYHFCNETLRGEFYKHLWSYDHCEKYSIFMGNVYFPLKGLHQILKALPIVLKDFPDTKLCIAGDDYITLKTFGQKIRQSGYAKYIRSLIKLYGIKDKVVFLGLLSEKEIVKRFLKSNVFICPSSIENSPNSLGEAQLLGVPCVAAYVGGIPDMIEQHKTGLQYRFEEIEMLAKHICTIFSDTSYAQILSENEKQVALKRHDPILNAETLISIYQKIIN